QAVAIEFDLVHPSRAGWRPLDQPGQLRRNEQRRRVGPPAARPRSAGTVAHHLRTRRLRALRALPMSRVRSGVRRPRAGPSRPARVGIRGLPFGGLPFGGLPVGSALETLAQRRHQIDDLRRAGLLLALLDRERMRLALAYLLLD